MNRMRITLFPALAVLCLSDPAVACVAKFDGTEFLVAAASRGLAPDSDNPCATVKMSENKFYAPPGASCSVLFKSADWLKHAKFKSIGGQGKFKAVAKDDSIQITIEKSGGFYLDWVKLDVDAEKCDAITIDDVLK